MKIGDGYILRSDSLQFIISKVTTGRSGLTVENTMGFFPTLRDALKFIVDHRLRATGFEDLEKVADAIDELHRLIEAVASQFSDARDLLQSTSSAEGAAARQIPSPASSETDDDGGTPARRLPRRIVSGVRQAALKG